MKNRITLHDIAIEGKELSDDQLALVVGGRPPVGGGAAAAPTEDPVCGNFDAPGRADLTAHHGDYQL